MLPAWHTLPDWTRPNRRKWLPFNLMLTRGDRGRRTAFCASRPAVEKRDRSTCWNFVQDVRQRVIGAPQITSDGYKGYIPSIDDSFGADCSYAMLIKSYGSSGEAGSPEGYHPPREVGIFHQVMFGDS